jgi:hypothetical protein
MDSHNCIEERQISFFIHLWLETGDRSAWRGRVSDGQGNCSTAFEDEQALLDFIRHRLSSACIVLPRRRGDS